MENSMKPIISKIYATTTNASQAQLTFTTKFNKHNVEVIVDLLEKSESKGHKMYKFTKLSQEESVSIKSGSIYTSGTLSLSADGKSVYYTGDCIYKDVASFSAENVAIAVQL